MAQDLGERIPFARFEEFSRQRPANRQEYYDCFRACYNLKQLPAFPFQLMLEATNRCNFACTICPSTKMSRADGMLDRATALKVIAESGEQGLYWLGFHLVGEPLLHPDLPLFIAAAKAAGIPVVNVTTNGYLLDTRCEELFAAGLDSLVISLSGNSAAQYNDIYRAKDMAGDAVFQRVRGNVIRASAGKRERKLAKPFIQINSTWPPGTAAEEYEIFRRFWQQHVDNVRIEKPASWIKGNPYNQPTGACRGPRYACVKLWRQAAVLCDGRVTLCCLDADGDLAYDSIGEKSLRDVWQGARHKEMLARHLANDYTALPFCAACHDGWQ